LINSSWHGINQRSRHPPNKPKRGTGPKLAAMGSGDRTELKTRYKAGWAGTNQAELDIIFKQAGR
jgi:hypothetical protein